jgi:hypothetical protein
MTRRTLLALTLLALLAGCNRSAPAPQHAVVVPATAPALPPAPEPYVLHVPGISGESWVDHTMIRGLAQGFAAAGVHPEIQIYDWTEHDPGIPALQAYARNRAEAKRIAALLTERFNADPRRTIYVTCHSGGAGLAAWALEDLDPRIKIQTLLFIAPALSPGYDLSRALRHVKRAAYVFWSNRDTAILQAGTTVFGTIDGVYAPAAGFTGFLTPKTAAAAHEYAKLHQIAYDPAWVRYYNAGDHIGPMETPFAREVLARVLRGQPLPTTAPSTQPSTVQ